MRPEKQFLLDEVKGMMDDHGSFLIMRYAGITANASGDFRRDVAKSGGNVEILRKRLLIKAAKTAGIDLELKQLEGHIGLVFVGPDALATTKYVVGYGKDNNDVIRIIGGRIDGQFYTGEQVEVLSTLPSKDEMRAQLLSTFEAPMSQTLAVMDAIMTSIMHCMDNHAEAMAEKQ